MCRKEEHVCRKEYFEYCTMMWGTSKYLFYIGDFDTEYPGRKQMEENNNTEGNRRPGNVLQVLVAVYLLYTSWSLMDAAAATQGKERLLIILAIVLFVVCGLLLLVKNVIATIRKK